MSDEQLRQPWNNREMAAYDLGKQTEREHQNALTRLVIEKHQAELDTLRARVAELEAAREYEPVPDGTYDGGNGNTYVISESGQRIRRYDNEFHAGTLWLPHKLAWRLMRRKEAQDE